MTDFLSRLEALAATSGTDLAARANAISEAYRAFVPSSAPVGDVEDALAYALTRAPATYAAVSRVLDEVEALMPGFAPRTVLDVGCGPGTASWALAERFDTIDRFTMIDHSNPFRRLAGALVAGVDHDPLREARIQAGDLSRIGEEKADAVVVAYALTELSDSNYRNAVRRLWAASRGVLIIVEPGRPRDYERLMGAREEVLDAGARIVAPCPHAAPCPLAAPDWCHFSVRLARSKAHRALKGAALGYEDEKFSYLVASREPVEARYSRVLSPPEVTKFAVGLRLCAPTGQLEAVSVAKRDGQAAFKAAKKRDWGDRVGD